MTPGNDGGLDVILRRLALICIAISAGISGIAIIGWMLGWLILAEIRTDYIPMALSAALLFIVLSGALLVYTRQPAIPHARMIVCVGVFLVILISLIILIDFFTGMALDIERLLVSSQEKFEVFPIGRMSPITAANFLLAGSALLLLLTSPAAGRQRARGAAAFLAILVIFTGFVVLLGYLYGTPLLYGGTIIPVPLTTALVFVFLGIGIILAAGQDYWPMSSFIGSSVSARLLRVFLPVTIALVLIVNFLDIVIFQNVATHVIVSSLATILSVIIFSIIIPKISHVIGSDIDRANAEKERAIKALLESEEKLRESESRLNKSQEIAHVGSWVLDISTNRLTWSDEVYRIFGLQPAEFNPTYEAFLDVIHPEDRAMVDAAYSGSLREGRDTYDIEHRIVRKRTGEIRHLHERCEHIKDATGTVIRSVGMVQDITERKNAEEELRKHRDHLEELVKERTQELSISREKEHASALYTRNLLETSLDPLVTISPDGKITDVNRATEQVTGVSREKLIGSDFLDYFTEPGKARESYMRVFEKGFVTDYPLAIRHKSGRVTDVLYNAAVYKNEAGKIEGVFAAARDVTERKRALEVLRMDERRLLSLLKISQYRPETLSNLLDMVLDEVVSLSDSKVGYICYYSEEKEEFTLNTWSKNVMESCAIQNPQTIYKLRETGVWGEAVRQRKPIIVNDFQAPNPLKKGYPEGHTSIFRFMTLPVFVNEHIVAVVGGGNKGTDYTDIDALQLKQMMDSVWLIAQRQQAEESMRFAKEEAERANMAKTNFLQTMSHELRTPLNAILGFSEVLKQKTYGELNEKQERFLDNIITGGNNLHNIISQILDVVRMDEGTLKIHIEKVPVPETVDEAIGVIKERAALKNVLIGKNLDPELEYIEADKQKFKKVFINLLDNAVKFSKPEGGNVTITAKKEGDMAKFSVSDTGIGIKDNDVDKLFQKFTQLDMGTTRKYGGTGIGLAITKQFVELHGGRIWAESKYGEGSTIAFTLPLKAGKGGVN